MTNTPTLDDDFVPETLPQQYARYAGKSLTLVEHYAWKDDKPLRPLDPESIPSEFPRGEYVYSDHMLQIVRSQSRDPDGVVFIISALALNEDHTPKGIEHASVSTRGLDELDVIIDKLLVLRADIAKDSKPVVDSKDDV